MVKIKSPTKNFKEILNLVKMTGKDGSGSTTDLMFGCVLKAEDKIYCNALSINGIGMCKLIYNDVIIEEKGELPVGDIQEFLSCLNRFSEEDEIVITKSDNKIILTRLKPKKQISLNITSEEYIAESLKAEELIKDVIVAEDFAKIKETGLNTKIKLNTKLIKEILLDADIKNISRRFEITIEPNLLTCVIGKTNRTVVTNEANVEVIGSPCKSVYIAGINNIFNNLEGDVILYMSNNCPMIVKKTCANYEVVYLIAPVAEND